MKGLEGDGSEVCAEDPENLEYTVGGSLKKRL